MPSALATAIFAAVVVGLFAIGRDRSAQTSRALWIPVLWVSLCGGSGIVTHWIGLQSAIESPDQYLDGNPLEQSMLAAVMAAGAFVLLARGPKVRALLRGNVPILVFLSYCATSILWSDYPFIAFKRWTKAVGEFLMVLIVLTDPDRPVAIKRFLTRLGILLVPASILLIKYYPELGQTYSGAEGKVRYTGVATDKNTLGAICLVVGLGCVWRLVDAFRAGKSTREAGSLTAQSALLAMVLWLFWQANSMTSLACFLLGSGVIIVLSTSGLARERAAVHILVVVVLGVAASALLLGVGAELVETMGRDSTLTGRTGLWTDLLRISDSPLLGTGFESFWLGKRLDKLRSIYWWSPNEAHNGYLEVFLNLGWMGVALLALVILTGYRNVVGVLERDPDSGSLRFGYLLVTALGGLTEAAFRVLNPVWFMFILSAMAVPQADASNGRATLGGTSRLQKNPSFDVGSW